MSVKQVRKRDGRVVPFNEAKIADAIFKAACAVGGTDRATTGPAGLMRSLQLERYDPDRSSSPGRSRRVTCEGSARSGRP